MASLQRMKINAQPFALLYFPIYIAVFQMLFKEQNQENYIAD